MMTNLFSMFDPSTSSNFDLNWLSLILFVFFWPIKFYFKNNRLNKFFLLLNKLTFKDMKNNINPNSFKPMMMLLIIFLMIFFMNYLSIMPFIFTPTAHISLTLFISFPFWINLMIKELTSYTMKTLAHMVPLGSPLVLTPFMVIIETISNLIRPTTLCIRLSANMIAGHILLTLLSNLLDSTPILYLLSSSVMNILLTLEFSVALIQSYVFAVLLSLYLSEV